MKLKYNNSLFATYEYQHTKSYLPVCTSIYIELTKTYSVFKENTDHEINHNTYSMFHVSIYTGGRPVVT